MAYNQLISNIKNYIKENGRQEITGQIMQDCLVAIIENLSTYQQFGGMAADVEVPDTENNVFYFAAEGTYPAFGNLEVGKYELAVFINDNGWVKETIVELPEGPQGPVGPEGPQGPVGPEGERGPQAVNPFKGWYISAASLPANPSVGDYAYVLENGTTYIYRCTTDGTWPSSSTEEAEPSNATFASSQLLNAVKIDDSGLNDAASEDETNNPTLARGMDVQQLARKLDGITFQETAVFKVASGEGQNFYNNYKIQGSDGEAVSNNNYGYIEIAVDPDEYDTIRFIGYNMNSGATATTRNIGYAFGHYNDTTWVTDYSHYFEATANANTVKEYVVPIPSGVTHFRTIARNTATFNNAFYLYLRKGDSVKSVISQEVDDIDLRIYKYDETKVNTGVFLSQGIKGRIERSNSTWYVSPYTSSYAKHYAIQVVAGQTVRVKANSSAATTMAFFTSDYDNTTMPTDGTTLPLADGLTYRVAPGSTMELRVPEGAVWCCFNTGANGEYVPSEVSIIKKGDASLLFDSDIEDNLDSYDTDKALSANQGRVLGDKLKDVNVKTTLATDYTVDNGTVSGTTGNILASETNKYAVIELTDAMFSLRFYGQTVGTGVTSGSAFYDEEGNFMSGNVFPARSGSTNEITEVVLGIPVGARYFKTTIQTSLMVAEDFYCYISEGKTVTEKVYEGASRHLTLSNTYIKDNGAVIASNKYVTTSPIYGGHGFYIELNEDYRIYKAVLFDVDGNMIDPSYIPYNLSTPTYNGAWQARTWFSSLCILPQWYVKLVIKRSDETSFTPEDGVVKEFCYLDDARLSRETLNQPYYAAAKNRLAQLTNLILMPKSKITASEVASDATAPSTTNDYFFYPGKKRSGVPYSEAIQYSKMVGLQVSPYTFLTAMHNIRSLMYTEILYDNQSGYGITYNSGSIHYYSSYFGIVCTALTGFVLGLPTFYHTEFYTNNGTDMGIDGMERVSVGSGSTAFDTVQLLDVVWYSGHCSIVTDIINDEYGNRKFVVWSESLRPTPYMTAYNKTNFNARFSRSSCRIYRLDPTKIVLGDVVDSRHVQVNWWDYPAKIAYNDDICTFAGDKATFAEGDPIWLNIADGYDTLEIYKDDGVSPLHTINVVGMGTDIDLTSYSLNQGKYKARLTGSGDPSGYTYFEVVAITLSYTISGADTVISFSAAGGTPVSVNCCSEIGYSHYIHPLTEEEKAAGTTTRQWDYTYNASQKYLRLIVRGEYGNVAIKNVLIS